MKYAPRTSAPTDTNVYFKVISTGEPLYFLSKSDAEEHYDNTPSAYSILRYIIEDGIFRSQRIDIGRAGRTPPSA